MWAIATACQVIKQNAHNQHIICGLFDVSSFVKLDLRVGKTESAAMYEGTCAKDIAGDTDTVDQHLLYTHT